MSPALHVLLVEDDHEDAELFRRRAPPSFQVAHVTGAEAALQAVQRRMPALAFVDYRLGADNGLDVVRALRAAAPRLPIIVVTGQEAGVLGENALLAGATDFVPKDSLSRPALERAARWALIRSHVERSTDDAVSARALATLLQRAPAPRPAADTLRRIVYLSRARVALAPPELVMLSARFAAANARVDVTGVLVLAGDRFMQVLEGPSEAVGVLLDRIAADPRHGDIAVVLDEPARGRLYGDWNMGYLNLGERHDLTAAGWAALVQEVSRTLTRRGADRPALDTLVRQLPDLLRGRSSRAVGAGG